MRHLLAAALLFAAPAARAAAPRLVVVVVVDQLRVDAAPADGPGFSRFRREGAWYQGARHGHLPTETAVGHAALSTGRFPESSGIVGNAWYDREAGREVSSVEDPRNASRGPGNLAAPTLGELLRRASPASRVVSVAGKDRSAVMMAGRGADLAVWLQGEKGGFASSADYPELPAWVESFNASSLPSPLPPGFLGSAQGDAAAVALAERAVVEMGLGRGEAPDLLWVSLGANDVVGHAKGPQSVEAAAIRRAADRRLGAFLSFLDRTLGRERYLAVLASDHGCLPSPESPEGRAVGARRASKGGFTAGLEESLAAMLGAAGAGRSWVRLVHPPHLYLDRRLASERGVSEAELSAAGAAALRRRPEVEEAYAEADLRPGAGGRARFRESVRRAWFPARSGDAVFVLKPGVYLTDSESEVGHGSPYDYDARVPLAFLGADVRPGVVARPVLTVDLAPTLARVLGVAMPFTDGSSPLGEAFERPLLPAAAAPARPLRPAAGRPVLR